MIVCPRCSKENQDHYKFCLGCGAELPRDAEPQPGGFSAPDAASAATAAPAPAFGAAPAFGGPPSPTPMAPSPAAEPPGPVGAPSPVAAPSAFGAPGSFGAPSPAPIPAAAPNPVEPSSAPPPQSAPPPAMSGGFGPPPSSSDTVICSKCGGGNNQGFKFCGSCGNPLDQSAPAAPAAAPPAAVSSSAGVSSCVLVLIRPDGTEGESVPIADGGGLGRDVTPQFAADTYLSPNHATFHFDDEGLTIRDESSLNGIYLRIESDQPVELFDQSVFRVGQEIIRFESYSEPEVTADGVERMGSPRGGLVGRIALITGRESTGNAYCVPDTGLHLGRERGDILFPDDGYVSGLHARIHSEQGNIFLTDVGSSNGTFIRISGDHRIDSGRMVLLGQQLFRVEY